MSHQRADVVIYFPRAMGNSGNKMSSSINSPAEHVVMRGILFHTFIEQGLPYHSHGAGHALGLLLAAHSGAKIG